MNTQNQIRFEIPNDFLTMFGKETHTFFMELLKPENSQDIYETIESLLNKPTKLDESKLIYELANYIRTDYIEKDLDKLSEISKTYIDIICDAVYSCDSYEIAKEVIKQYNLLVSNES